MVPRVWLERGRARVAEIEALAAMTGGRVGLAGVLADLDREAVSLPVRDTVASRAYGWAREDDRDARWWPQGITSSADAASDEAYDGRALLLTTWYSKVVRGVGMGARITVMDVTDPDRPRYRHVLLVRPRFEPGDRLRIRPVPAHAGGVVWRGRHLHVADTRRGLYTFDLDDIVPVWPHPPDVLGPHVGSGVAGFGHRYALPVRYEHVAHTGAGARGVRYSFLSLGHAEGPTQLLAGEYARNGAPTRLLGYDVDPSTGLLVTDPAGSARPSVLHGAGTARMQGAVRVDDRFYVTTSNGRRGRSSVWAGEPGSLVQHEGILPPGVEDVCYWPSQNQLWTSTEYPKGRVVLALDRSRFD